jgi:CRP-like cAMP-binding protein
MLDDVGERKSYEDGDTIFAEGSRGRVMYVIESGQVELDRRSMQEGRDVDTVVARLGPGDFFGEMSLFDGEPRSARAIAVGSVDVRPISKKELLSRIRKEPEVALEFLSELSQRIRSMDSLVESIVARGSLDADLLAEIGKLRSSA